MAASAVRVYNLILIGKLNAHKRCRLACLTVG